MKISDLFNYENLVYIEDQIDTEKELIIEREISKTREDSIYFYYKAVNETSTYSLPDFSEEKPYAVVCEWDSPAKDGIRMIRVKNVRRALAYSYSHECRINYSKLKIIGVTGTNGKTSTAQMISAILRHSGEKVGFIGTGIIAINDEKLTDDYYSMTTPDPHVLYPTLKKMQDAGCRYVVMEVSSHAIALSKIAPIRFECCVFTNLSSEHSDFHKNMEDYYKTKLSLFDNARYGIFNLDDEYSRRAYNEVSCKKYSVGAIRRGDGYIIDFTSFGLSGSSFFYKDRERIFKVNIKLAGAHNVYNALLAIECTLSLGVRACVVKDALQNIEFLPGRLERIKSDIEVVIDYAHTPNALENILKLLFSVKKAGQKLFLVFGCGGNRDTAKRRTMGEIAEKYADLSIITEDNSREEKIEKIISEITAGMTDNEKYKVIKSRRNAIRYAILNAELGDIVAVVGKGHERYIINETGHHPFDERIIINEALAERRMRSESPT